MTQEEKCNALNLCVCVFHFVLFWERESCYIVLSGLEFAVKTNLTCNFW